MEPILVLTVLSLAMLLGCYIAGSIPLVMTMSEVSSEVNFWAYLGILGTRIRRVGEEPYCHLLLTSVLPSICLIMSEVLWASRGMLGTRIRQVREELIAICHLLFLLTLPHISQHVQGLFLRSASAHSSTHEVFIYVTEE